MKERVCKMCGEKFQPESWDGQPPQLICMECIADALLRDIERDEKLNEREEPPRSELKYNVQGL